MRRLILFILLVLHIGILSAGETGAAVKSIMEFQEQKNIYSKFQQNKEDTVNIYTPLEPEAISAESNNTEPCFKLSTIRVEGIKLFKQEKIEPIIEPYVKRCVTLTGIKNMVTSINNLYLSESFITSRAFIQPQNLASGQLTISVLEGTIESAVGKGVNTDLVFAGLKNTPLNLRELEARVEQLNRLQSIKTTMSIEPGSKPGFSNIIAIGKHIGSNIHGSAGVNNFGMKNTGKIQFNTLLKAEDITGHNDLLSVTLNGTNKQSQTNRSNGAGVSYGIPVQKSYLELQYKYSSYRQPVAATTDTYLSKGHSHSVKADIQYKLFHTLNQRGELESYLSWKRNKNYLADVLLENSSDTLSVFALGYTHHYTAQTWDGYMTLNYLRGLNIFGAHTESGDSNTFNKLVLDTSFNKHFYLSNSELRYNMSMHAQVAPKNIIASEQIGVGGIYSVRGFEDGGSLSGNNGLYIRNELSYLTSSKNGTLSPYIAVDYGKVQENDQSEGGQIVGGAVGARIDISDFSMDVFHTFKLKGSDLENQNGMAGVSLNYSF